MSSSDATFSGRSNHILRLNITYVSQNAGGNYSTIYWELLVIKASGTGSYSLDNRGSWSININGQVVNGGGWSYDFRSSTVVGLGSGYLNISHDGAGNGSSNSYASADSASTLGSTSLGPAYDTYPFIPKRPAQPGTPSLSSSSPSTISAAWATPGNGGSAITQYRMQYSESSTFSSATIVDTGSSAASYTLTGLAPGKLYYVRVAAHNAYGISDYSGSRSIKIGIGGKRAAAGVFNAFSTAKRFDGASFVDLSIGKRYNGTSWVDVT